MKKTTLFLALLLMAVTASADRKYATFVAPKGSGATYDTETCVYHWTKGSDNLMRLFTFTNGELANFTTLKIVRLGGTYSDNFRLNILFSDGKDKNINTFYNYYDKSLTLSDWDLTVGDVSHTLADITEIRFGGNSGTDCSVTIDWTCVYLENDNDAVVTAAFAKPASNATYTNTSYNANKGNDNLMDIFTKASEGDFTKYGKLQMEIQSVSGMMRVGYHDGSAFTIIGSGDGYGGGGVKHIDLSSYSSAASSGTTIKFGSKDKAGSCTIRPDQVFLVRSEAYTREFTADKKSTVWLPFALTAEEVADVDGKFYELTAADGTTLTFTEVTGATEAYKPYVFVAKSTGTPFSGMKAKTIVAPKTCAYTVGDYTFVGAMKDTDVPNGAYGYSGNKFVKASSDNVDIQAFRAYIVANTSRAQSRGMLDIDLQDGTTGIDEAKVNVAQPQDDAIYNLAGQKVDADYKGIVIKNGKKMIVR